MTPDTFTAPSLGDFAFLYLYGLTSQPYRQSTDLEKFGQLYSLAIGEHGGAALASSFHPYQLAGPAGVTVWYAAYAQLYAQPDRAALFASMADEQARYVVAPPASFGEFHRWPDARLSPEENPVFGHYVPFVLPFLVRKTPDALRWDAELATAAGNRETFATYLDALNEAIRFVQPAPAFVLGFDEFDEQHPEQLVERFMSVRDTLLVR